MSVIASITRAVVLEKSIAEMHRNSLKLLFAKCQQNFLNEKIPLKSDSTLCSQLTLVLSLVSSAMSRNIENRTHMLIKIWSFWDILINEPYTSFPSFWPAKVLVPINMCRDEGCVCIDLAWFYTCRLYYVQGELLIGVLSLPSSNWMIVGVHVYLSTIFPNIRQEAFQLCGPEKL